MVKPLCFFSFEIYYLMSDKTLSILCTGKKLFWWKKIWLFSDVWMHKILCLFIWVYVYMHTFCLAYGANNVKVAGLISVTGHSLKSWTHWSLWVPSPPVLTQNILWFCNFPWAFFCLLLTLGKILITISEKGYMKSWSSMS